MSRKLALDTNLFIDAFRNTDDEARLTAFHARYAPFEYLSAIVALELLAGARDGVAGDLQRHVFDPLERRGRVFAPSHDSWKAAGAALGMLAGRDGLRLAAASRGFVNDVLLAASCREHGITLVTRNVRDFERIRRVLRFDFVAAWP